MTGKGWTEGLLTNDGGALWTKLFRVISRHSSVRVLCTPLGISGEALIDFYNDLTQDLFLKLHSKNRWQTYIDLGYTNEDIEREIYRIEVPNLVSHLQREWHPESYRMARRISDLLQNCGDFQVYPPATVARDGAKRACNKMALRLYGLGSWPLDKEVKPNANLSESIKAVPFRRRDTRRTGRGSGSQVIISTEELKRLIRDIFEAIDTPTEVRTMRSLVLSKLAVEDWRPVSIDAGSDSHDADTTVSAVELADSRPSPLDVLLKKEEVQLADKMAEQMMEKMKNTVRGKPGRFRKLVEVAWHCYFDPSLPSQTSIASKMRISDSLVSHYRRIFDSLVMDLATSIEEMTVFNSALDRRLCAMVSEFGVASDRGMERSRAAMPPPTHTAAPMMYEQ